MQASTRIWGAVGELFGSLRERFVQPHRLMPGQRTNLELARGFTPSLYDGHYVVGTLNRPIATSTAAPPKYAAKAPAGT